MKVNTSLLSKITNIINIIDTALEMVADKLTKIRVKGTEELDKLEDFVNTYIPTTREALSRLEKYEQILRNLIRG